MNSKIIFVCGTFFPATSGGPDNSNYWLASKLQKMGYDVEIISFFRNIQKIDIKKYSIKPNKKVLINGLPVTYFSYVQTRLFSYNFWKTVFNIQKSNNNEFVFLNSFFFFINPLIAIFFRKKKLILSTRGEINIGALSINRYKKLFIKNLFYYIYKNFINFFHFTSLYEYNNFTKIFSNKINYKILNNFIPRDLISYNKNENSKNNFFYLGRINKKKRIESIIIAFSQAKKKINGCELIIAGQGDEKYLKYLKKLTLNLKLNDCVRFIGHQNYNQKKIFLSNSKCLILFSSDENWGNVVLEALSHGTPCLVSQNMPWNFINDYCGYVCVSQKDLTNNMVKIIKMSQSNYKILCRNALQVANSFVIDNNENKIKNFFEF